MMKRYDVDDENREDVVIVEVFCFQFWQWVCYGVIIVEGKKVDKQYVFKFFKEQIQEFVSKVFQGNKYGFVVQYFFGQVIGEDYVDFLMSLLYNEIIFVGLVRVVVKL